MATKAERRAAYDQRIRDQERARAGHELEGMFDRTLDRAKHTKEARISEVLFGLRLGEGSSVRTRRMRRSISKWARFQGWWWMIPFTVGLSAIPLLRFFAVVDGLAAFGGLFVVVGAPIVLLTLVALLWSVGAANRELAAERTWVAALPYDLVDYEECLGEEPRWNDGHVEVVFTFDDKVPTTQELAPLFALSDREGNWELSGDGRIATLKPGPCGSNDRHNLRFAVWFHRVVEERLASLHERFPLIEVRLRNELWEHAEREAKRT